MSHVTTSQSRTKIAGVLAVAAAAAITTFSGAARAQELGEPRVIGDNTGAGIHARPGAYFPSRGDTGFNVDATATYGIAADPFVIAPGGRFAGYFGDQGALSGMPVVEVMLPVGAFVPYVKGGAGYGYANGPDESGLALMAGGGLDLHITRDVLLGVDATWETVQGTGFNAVSVGPRAGIRY